MFCLGEVDAAEGEAIIIIAMILKIKNIIIKIAVIKTKIMRMAS